MASGSEKMPPGFISDEQLAAPSGFAADDSLKIPPGFISDDQLKVLPVARNQGQVMLDSAKEGLGKGAAWVGDKIERYVDAPFRAGLNAVAGSGVLPTPEKAGKFYDAAKAQFGQDTLPTTPSPEQQAEGAGMPGWFGRVASPSVALPIDQLVALPLKAGAAAAKGAAEFAAPVVEAAGRANEGFQKGVLKLGERLTEKEGLPTMNAADAFASSKFESGLHMLKPEMNVNTLLAAGSGEMLGGYKGAILTTAISKATDPKTYLQIVGASKLPGDAARALMGAYETASNSEMAKVVSDLAQKYPSQMAKITAGVSQAANNQKSQEAMSRRLQGGNP